MDGLLTLIKLTIVDFTIYALPVTFIELLSVLAGIYYLKKSKSQHPATKYFVWFLGLTFFTEVVGAYSPIAYFSDYEYFGFVQDTSFERNKWLYNFYSLFFAVFYTYYFRNYLKNKLWRLILKVLIVLFIVSSIINLTITGVFFTEDSAYVNLVGTFLIFFSITLFYFELLRSDILLNLKRYLPLYISIGVLVFTLCMTPISLFSEYFNEENSAFVKLQSHLILYSNLFMYTFFIIGFYICRKRTTYS